MSRTEVRSKLPKARLIDGRSIICIGWCSGTTAAFKHVGSLLVKAGIEPHIEGSCAYDIWVLVADVARAMELLTQDPYGDQYRVTLYQAKPNAKPNDGPANRLGGSGVRSGPPSVS